MDARATSALAGAALTLCACGYDYQDRAAALDREPAVANAAGCQAGEPVEGARKASVKEVASAPDAFAKATLRVRGILKSAGDGGDRLVTKEGELRVDLAALPPFLIESCPNREVDVDGTMTVGRGDDKAPVLHALAMAGAGP